jgi:hypothetical protein
VYNLRMGEEVDCTRFIAYEGYSCQEIRLKLCTDVRPLASANGIYSISKEFNTCSRPCQEVEIFSDSNVGIWLKIVEMINPCRKSAIMSRITEKI